MAWTSIDRSRILIPRDRATVTGAPAPWGPFATEQDAARSAYKLLRELRPGWTLLALQIALGDVWKESRYGVTPSWQFPDGTPSWNAGAMIGEGSAGSIKHGDVDKDGNPETYDFEAWNTQREGLASYLDALMDPAIAYMQRGNVRGMARVEYDVGWYEGTAAGSANDGAGNVEAQAQQLDGAAGHVAGLIGQPRLIKASAFPPVGYQEWEGGDGGGGDGGGGGGGGGGGDGGGGGKPKPKPKPKASADDGPGIGTAAVVVLALGALIMRGGAR